MLREIITPVKQDVMIHLPQEMVGKKVEVIAFEIGALDDLISKEERRAQIEELTKKTLTDLSGFKFDRNEANNYGK